MSKSLQQEEPLADTSSVEVLKQLVEEVTAEIISKTPAKKLLRHLSLDELLTALSQEMRAALALWLKDYEPLPDPDIIRPESDPGKA